MPRTALQKRPTIDWRARLRADPLPWLLEESEPAVRYLALRDLLDRPADDPVLLWAQAEILGSPTVQTILAAQRPEGYWAKPGPGYMPGYRGTLWTLILLAELGVPGDAPAVRNGCNYLLDHALTEGGDFVAWRLFGWDLPSPVPALCLPGNALFFLLRFGFGEEPRVQRAVGRLAERSLASQWKCAAARSRPCWWAAVKTLKALAELPAREGTVAETVARASELLLSVPYWDAGHPAARDPNWAHFGFPLFYHSDLLEIAEVLCRLGLGGDPRIAEVVALIAGKQDVDGTWPLERTFSGQMHADIEAQGEPSKWVTLRALRVLKAAVRIGRDIPLPI